MRDEDQPIRFPRWPEDCAEGSPPPPMGVLNNAKPDDRPHHTLGTVGVHPISPSPSDTPPGVPVGGYYGSCHRCHEHHVTLFRRPFHESATWDLCRGCIATLGLERPVGVFDQDEVDERGLDDDEPPYSKPMSVATEILGAILCALVIIGVAAILWTILSPLG